MSYSGSENDSSTEDKPPEIDEEDAEGGSQIQDVVGEGTEEINVSSIQETLPSSDYKEYETPGIGSCRRATQNDIASILNLIKEETRAFFGDGTNIGRLIENAHMSFSLYSDNDDLISFVSLCDYPNLVLPPAHWEEWLRRKFNFRTAFASNTLFIHLIVWDELCYPECINHLFAHAYSQNVFLEHIIITTPPFSEPFNLLNDFFKMVERPGELRPNRTQNVYINKRGKHARRVYIRNSDYEDVYNLTNMIKCFKKRLISIYGEDLVLDIFDLFGNEKIGIVGQGASLKDIGFILCNTNINYSELDDIFNLQLFYSTKKFGVNRTIFDPSLSTVHEILPQKPLEPITSRLPEPRSSPSIQMEGNTNSEHYDYDDDYDIDALRDFTISTMMLNLPTNEEDDVIVTDLPIPKTQLDWSHHFKERYSIEIQKTHKKRISKHVCTASSNGHNVPNAFSIELFFLGPEQDEKCCYDYLIGAFNLMPNYDYCLISIPSQYQPYSLLGHFYRLSLKPREEFLHDVYVTHRSTLFGRITIRYANPSDFEDIVAISRHEKSSKRVQKDAYRSIFLGHKNIKTLMFLVDGEIFGFAILCPLFETEFLRAHYNLENLMLYDHHKGDEHCFVKHMQMSSLFIPKTRFILKEVMRFTGFTSLYAVVFTENLSKRNQIMSLAGLMHWVPVSPRRLPIYSKALRSRLPPYHDNPHNPFGLFYINTRICSTMKILCNFRIVIVGSGDTTLGFLEHLIFSPTSVHRGYGNIVLICDRGLPPGELFEEESWARLRRSMLVERGRYQRHYLQSLALHAWVTVVRGRMTAIDRKEKLVVVEGGEGAVRYDYLFLFCGKQFGKPPAPPKGVTPLAHCRMEFEKNPDLDSFLEELPKNMFVINNEFEAEDALRTLRVLMLKREEGQLIVVYGHSLNALACINCLRKFGLPSSYLVYVEPFPVGRFAIDLFNNPTLYDASKTEIYNDGIKILTPYKLADWVVADSKIQKINFESNTQMASITCLAFFCLADKTVHPKTFMAVTDAALVYDGLLVIDHNFKTNDPCIYSAGPMTKYGRKYYAPNYYHEHYNSIEVGAEAASRFQKFVEEDDEFPPEENNCWGNTGGETDVPAVVEFTWPVIESCALLGGWHYFRARRPGPDLPLETMLNHQHDLGRILTTGQPLDPEGPGYFRIFLDQNNIVIDVTCYSHNEIDMRNLICIYGKHETLLNHLLQRYDCGQIPDLFDYFRQPWAYFIYHDRYPLLREENQLLSTSELSGGSFSILQLIAERYHQAHWKNLDSSDITFIENYCIASSTFKNIRDNLLNYFIYNDNHLTMFVTPQRIKELYEDLAFSPLLEETKKMAGERYPELQPYVRKSSGQKKLLWMNKIEYFHGAY